MTIHPTWPRKLPQRIRQHTSRLAGIAALVLAAAIALPTFAAAAAPSELRIASFRHPTTLDPLTGSSGYDHTFLYPVYDTLIDLDPATLELKPGLAERWTFTDPKTLVLDLRAGVTFHDGTAFDAEAVRLNLERARNGERSNVKANLNTIERIEVSGPLQVTLHLKEPDITLPGVLTDRAGMMVSPQALKAGGATNLDRNPVGTGPWKFVSWISNDSLTFQRNESYWRKDAARVDVLNFVYVADVNTGLRSVIAGQNHLVYGLSPQQKSVVDRAKGIVAVSAPTLQVNQFFLNYGKPPLNDARVRRAVNLAIDRDQFAKVTSLGLSAPASSLFPVEYWAHDPGIKYERNVEKARELLKEAGYPDGVTLSAVGLPDQAWQQRQEVLISMLALAGIKLNVVRLAPAAGLARFFKDRNDDVFISLWTGRADPSMTFDGLFAVEAFFNAGHTDVTGGTLTAAMAQARSIVDRSQRIAALNKVQKIVYDNDLFTPLNFETQLIAHTDKLEGFTPNLLGKPRFEGVAFKK